MGEDGGETVRYEYGRFGLASRRRFRLRWIAREMLTANDGAWWVVILTLATAAAVAGATYRWWPDLARGDTATNVMRNMALIGGGVVAWLFAFWRSITARKQAETARREYQSGRLRDERAALMGEKSTSHERISALHELRYVARDAPELAVEVFEHIGTFVVQAPTPDGGNGFTAQDYRVAILSAEFALDRIVKHQTLGGNLEPYQRLARELASLKATAP